MTYSRIIQIINDTLLQKIGLREITVLKPVNIACKPNLILIVVTFQIHSI